MGKELPLPTLIGSASAVNDKIYGIGGKPADALGGDIANVYEFDLVTQNWKEKAPM